MRFVMVLGVIVRFSVTQGSPCLLPLHQVQSIIISMSPYPALMKYMYIMLLPQIEMILLST